MNLDISHILRDWPYEPGRVGARKIIGADGKEKIQLRLDLGLLQMEAEGRPDGRRPHDRESLLDYYQMKLREEQETRGSDEGFQLGPDACEQLRAEALMYYHRYLAGFVLGSYEMVIRDTQRNLRLFNLCRKYASDETDRNILEQYRPYVLMMHTRAKAHHALDQKRTKAALAAVREGINRIEQFYRQHDRETGPEASNEIDLLRELAAEIEAKIPVDPMEKMQRELSRAVQEERYEDAASLRDRIRQARGGEDQSGRA